MSEAGGSRAPDVFRAAGQSPATDDILDGRLRLKQFRSGHRVGTDAILLAAASAPLAPGDRFVDVGAGVGAVGLALAIRAPDISGTLLEIDPGLAALAAENCVLNRVEGRVRAVAADLFDLRMPRPAGLDAETATLVVTNPPFHLPGAVRASADAVRARAHVLHGQGCVTSHSAWIRAALSLLAPKGRFFAIHRPEALPTLIEGWDGRLGAVAILPVYATADRPAIRVLVTGVKGSHAPMRIAPALTLHLPDGSFTPEAAALHRGEAVLRW